MKIDKQPLEDHQVKLIVEIELEKLDEAKQRAGRKIAKQVKIPGFRPGKAPYAMVLRQVGEAAILEEATEILVNDIYPAAIEQAEIEPYGPGSLENIVTLEPPTFEFVVPLKAKVELGDYRAVRLEYAPKQITPQDVERVVDDLRDRQAVQETVQRAAEEGDIVYIHLSGERKQVEEDQSATLVKDRSMPVIIALEGAEEQNAWPYPGFSRNLIGLSAGDEKTITHTFSDDSPYESLRGVEAEFHVRVEDVKSRTLPELNNEFAQSIGEYSSLEDLTTKIQEDLQHHEQESYDEDYEQRALEEITKDAVIHYPPQMLEREIDTVIESLQERLAQQKQDLDLYLKMRKMDMAALREEVRPVAEGRLKKSLVLFELSEAEKIQLNPEEVQSETSRTLEMISRTMSKKDVQRFSDRETVSNLVGNIMMDMVTHRTLERVRNIAAGKVEAAEMEVEMAEGSESIPAKTVENGETTELVGEMPSGGETAVEVPDVNSEPSLPAQEDPTTE